MYIHGRDRNYRPILITHPGRIAEFVCISPRTPQEDCPDKIAQVCIFMFEYIFHYMIIPGKVENWTVIVDLGKVGVTDIPRKVGRRLEGVGNKRHGGLFADLL